MLCTSSLCCSIFNDRSLPPKESSLSCGQLDYYITYKTLCQYLFESFSNFFQKILTRFSFVISPCSSGQLCHYTAFASLCQELFQKNFLFVNFALIFDTGFAHSRQNSRIRSKNPYFIPFFIWTFWKKRSKIR